MKKNNVKKVLFAIVKYGIVLTVEFSGGVLGMILWFKMSVPDWMSVTLTIASFAAFAGTISVIDDAIEAEKKKKKRMAKRRAMREKKPSKTYKYLSPSRSLNGRAWSKDYAKPFSDSILRDTDD